MSLSVAIHDTPHPRPSEVATLSLWSGHHGLVDLSSPSFVASPSDHAGTISWIDLREVGYAYRATAVAFAPDGDWTSVTLCEALDTAGHPIGAQYDHDRPGLFDLFRIGWAARIGGVVFRR